VITAYRHWLLSLVFVGSTSAFASSTASPIDRSALPFVPEPFKGELRETEDDSDSYVPRRIKAPQGAPNVVLVLTDDVGFGAASTFGGPVPTPELDALAARGLRYNRFHTTGICSPTRAALLTGRNHHTVGSGMLADIASPYPGYTSRIPRSAATVARILRDNGYNTAMFGKDHNVPSADRSPAGPFEQWPTGRGFEHFYGFVAGDTNQWRPALFDGTTPVDSEGRDENYLLDRDLIDRAINWVHNQQAAAPNKPFFMYYAPGTAHAPLQAPKDWIARFQGKFDHGWDEERERILARQKALGVVPANTQLAARPDQIPAWDSLSETEKKVYARYMEVFAAMLAYQDAQFGRLMQELERMGIADNTLVLFIEGDNGSSGEGGAHGTLNELAHLSSEAGEMPVDIDWLAQHLDLIGGPKTYLGNAVGWSFATGTPFPWVKQIASHLGGVRNGMVVSWPNHIEHQGEIRSQYHHVIDILPTILEAAGIPAPKVVDGVPQQNIDGASMLYSFSDGAAPSPRNTQYYEILGNRGIYHDGWLASTTPRNMPWDIAKARKGSDITTQEWELYNLSDDFSQSHNLAKQNPEHLAALRALFNEQAEKYQVFPIHDTGAMARVMKLMRHSNADFKFVRKKTLWGPDIHLSLAAAPPIFSFPFTVDAEISVPAEGANGVILAAGSQFGGWSFYLDNGVPVAVAADSPLPGGQSRVAATEALRPGHHQLRYIVEADDLGGTVTIELNGQQIAEGPVSRRPAMMAGGGETFDTGRDSNDAVSTDYVKQGRFSGTLHKVTVAVQMPLWQRAMMKLIGAE
jgi:arylsulfatase A-like enzyme